MKNSAKKTSRGLPGRAKKTVIQFSLCLALASLCYRGIHTANTITLGKDTREEYLNASKVYSKTKLSKTTRVNDSYTRKQHDEVTDESFWLENLDVSKPVRCGANKCFFELKGDPHMGYLISPEKFRFEHRKGSDEVFKALDASFQFAEYLRREHNIEHFLRTPPTNITVSKVLASYLNSNIWSEARQEKLEKSRFQKGKLAFAQKVTKAPESTIIFGCTASKRGLFSKRVAEFLTHVKDKDAFVQNFVGNITAMKKLLEAETCLLIDFHALIDAEGQIFHLDFDRCFSNQNLGQRRSKKPSASCFRVIDRVEKELQDLLKVRQQTLDS